MSKEEEDLDFDKMKKRLKYVTVGMEDGIEITAWDKKKWQRLKKEEQK